MTFVGDALTELDYRSPEDDAWFSVVLFLIDDVLVVRYVGFSTDFDEVFPADSFDCVEEVDRFEMRFRPASLQLQDSRCRTVKEGTEVCASHHFENNDLKFFDATVVEVQNREHNHAGDGQETCSCTFWVLWHHGPLMGRKTSAMIDNICVVSKDKQIHPALISFLKKARKHIANKPDELGVLTLNPAPSHGNITSEPKQLSNTYEPRIGASVHKLSSPEDGLVMSKPSGASGPMPKEMKPVDEYNASSPPLDFCLKDRARRRGNSRFEENKVQLQYLAT